jgi:glutathione S-transferase
MRKVEGEFRALADWIGNKEFIAGDKHGLADVAAVTLGVSLDMLM